MNNVHLEPFEIIPCAIPNDKRFHNLCGLKFGRLTVVEFVGRRRNVFYWSCLCECGNTHYAASDNLKYGRTSSCGCLRKEVSSKNHRVHGLSDAPEAYVWSSMKARCYNQNTPNFFRYGGRGIRICESWLSDFTSFYRDMGPRPSPKHSLERRDNNGHYEPSNCYWATVGQQARNRRSNVNLTFNGVTMCCMDWDDHLGFLRATVKNRLKRGWTVERALTEPLKRRTKITPP